MSESEISELWKNELSYGRGRTTLEDGRGRTTLVEVEFDYGRKERKKGEEEEEERPLYSDKVRENEN